MSDFLMDGGLDVRSQAQHEWEQARRKAMWTQLKSYFLRRDTSLADFQEVLQKMRLRNPRYKGVQDIPLEKIVGSVGRYRDFVADFLPTTPKMAERWERIAELYLHPASGGVPPIEVYRVGELYFVKDGNHRVSVATQLKLPTIEAHVWEYPLEIDPQSVDTGDLDAMLMAAEKQDFFQTTLLDQHFPDHKVQLSLPGGYRELLDEIYDYQDRLAQIDAEDSARPGPMSLPEVAAAWYEMVFTPSLHIIQRHQMMQRFPGRSPADMFIFVRRWQEHLEDHYGHNIRLTQALRAIDDEQQNVAERVWSQVKQWWQH